MAAGGVWWCFAGLGSEQSGHSLGQDPLVHVDAPVRGLEAGPHDFSRRHNVQTATSKLGCRREATARMPRSSNASRMLAKYDTLAFLACLLCVCIQSCI
jgi:hypothetical protein